VTIVLRSALPAGFPADARRAALRSRDAWLAAGAATAARWELVVREPEAMVPPGALESLPLDLPAGESLAPEGFFRGGSAPGEAYATVWQFEQEAGRRRSSAAMPVPFGPGVLPPVELRRIGEMATARPRPWPGWVVHSFAGRRSWDRAELLRFVPQGARKVLDVGCGEGAFAALLEAAGARVTAVEPDPSAAAVARRLASRVLEATLETALDALLGERFDLVVMADVLEHLMDPVAALRALNPLLAPDGAFLLSLPNASHAAVLAGILQGRWDHALEGIVADDHRTYAGRAGWDRLLAAAGLAVAEWVPVRLAIPSLSPWMGVLSGTGLGERDLEAVQWMGLARPGPPARPGPRLDPIAPAGKGELDADDPVASVRALLRGREEVTLRSPNALAGPCVLPLFAGEVVSGEGRTALARGTTAHGLERRFRGSGIDIRLVTGKAEGPSGLLRRLTDEALRAGLPAAPEVFQAPDLDLRFRWEAP